MPVKKGVRVLAFRVSPQLHEALRRHAFERTVSANTLVNDILSLWVNAATDPKDPMFTGPLALGLPPIPNDSDRGRYPGYTDSLIFKIDEES